MIKVLILGANGQLGNSLMRRFAGDAIIKCVGIERERLDVRDEVALGEVLDDEKPDAVINAAAYTGVDNAEGEVDLAWEVNAVAPGMIASECVIRGIALIHIGTDYVFNGENGGTAEKPYEVTDKVEPLGVYGKSKEAGERAVQMAEGRYWIVRTGWLYDNVGQNFFTTMERLGCEGNEIKVVDDQMGTPTWVGSLSEAIRELIVHAGRVPNGVWHFSDVGVTSWKGFAEAIFQGLEMKADLKGISTAEYPTSAKRPMNSHLNGAKFREILNLPERHWEESLKMCIKTK